MSQAGRPRPRYIAFKVEAARPVGRQAFGNALKGRARHEEIPEEGMPKLTRYEWPHGIVWADHRYAETVRALLGRITWVVEGSDKVDVTVAPLLTSGTIKALTDRTGLLRERGKQDGPRPPKTGKERPKRSTRSGTASGPPASARRQAPPR